MSKVYLCTAIPYVNGNPHIGHAMDYLLADTYARFRRSLGDEVRLSAGTDEHGNKVYSKALASGLTVEEFATQNSDKFRQFIDRLDISYTDFIRTTDAEHVRRCSEIWRRLEDHIYSAEYHGWYCDGCESFVTQTEYDDNHGLCPDHQKPYQKLSEKNYYLRIADFKDQIREKIESGEMQILPEFRRQEVLKLLADAPDISISRPRKELSWGVPVPGDDTQVMYVWLDALSNYITTLGYPDTADTSAFTDWWPATAQFVGKDILRFHAITWPAILLGLGLPLPRTIVSHGHVLSDNQKMSKSIGNVVDPLEVIERHGLPAFRYYFLRHIDTFADSDFTWEKFDSAYSNELANDLGNLVQRLATLCHKNQVERLSEISTDMLSSDFLAARDECRQLMQDFEFSKAFDLAWRRVQAINKSIDQAKPWELAKQGQTAVVREILRNLVNELLATNELLAPFLPETAQRIAAVFLLDRALSTPNEADVAAIDPQIISVPATPLFPKN